MMTAAIMVKNVIKVVIETSTNPILTKTGSGELQFYYMETLRESTTDTARKKIISSNKYGQPPRDRGIYSETHYDGLEVS